VPDEITFKCKRWHHNVLKQNI